MNIRESSDFLNRGPINDPLTKFLNEASIMDEKGRGAIFNLISIPDRLNESTNLIDLLIHRLGIEASDIVRVPIQSIVNPREMRDIFNRTLHLPVPAYAPLGDKLFFSNIVSIGTQLVEQRLMPSYTSSDAPRLLLLEHPPLHPDFTQEGVRDFEHIYEEYANMPRENMLDAFSNASIVEVLSLGIYHKILSGEFGKNVAVNYLDDSHLRASIIGVSWTFAGFRPLARVLNTASTYEIPSRSLIHQ